MIMRIAKTIVPAACIVVMFAAAARCEERGAASKQAPVLAYKPAANAPTTAPASAAPVLSRAEAMKRAITRSMPSCVGITASLVGADGQRYQVLGSGVFIHELGYILTSNAIASGPGEWMVTLSGGRVVPAHVVVNIPKSNIAIMKAQIRRSVPAIKIGRSNDLILGEPVFSVGNPDGMTHSASIGIISGLHRPAQMTALPSDDGIQASIPFHPSFLGGPLINDHGELVGVVGSKREDVERMTFALPIDEIRGLIFEAASQEITGLTVGLSLDIFGTGQIVSIAPDSSAAQAGIKPGDTLKMFDGFTITDSVQFALAKFAFQQGSEIDVKVIRDGKEIPMRLTMQYIQPIAAVDVPGAKAGMQCDAYQGLWNALPDFSKLTPVLSAPVGSVTTDVIQETSEGYGLRFTGYIHIAQAGYYTFYLKSDDGSRLTLGKDVLLNNDGVHEAKEVSASVRLAAGKHPIVVEYFQAGGAHALTLSYEGPGIGKRPVPGYALFMKP